jgi:hypothetical protein
VYALAAFQLSLGRVQSRVYSSRLPALLRECHSLGRVRSRVRSSRLLAFLRQCQFLVIILLVPTTIPLGTTIVKPSFKFSRFD